MRKIEEILFSPQEVDVLLIQPNLLMKILEKDQNQIVREYWASMNNEEPLGDLPNEVNHGLFSLAASLRESEISVDVLDYQAFDRYVREKENRLMNEDDLDKSFKVKKAKIFGISTITVSSGNSLKIAEYIRKYNPEALIVFGGMHPTLFGETYIKEDLVDLIILGEGNQTIVEIAKAYPDKKKISQIQGVIYKAKDGEIVKTPKKSNFHLDLDALPYPAYDLVCEESMPLMPRFFTAKGCPFSCAFCSCDAFYKNAYDDYKMVYRDPVKVVDEIEKVYKEYKMDFYCFGDLTFMANKEMARKICEELINRGLSHVRWWCQTTVGRLTAEDLALMKKAGCAQVGLGVENSTQKNLDIMGKPVRFDATEEQCKLIRQAGLDPITYWILGLGDEDFESAKASIERICYFIRNNLTQVSHIGVPVPYPGSPIWKKPENYGFTIISTDFNNYWMNSDELGYSLPAVKTNYLSAEHIYALWQYALMSAANEYKKRKCQKKGD